MDLRPVIGSPALKSALAAAGEAATERGASAGAVEQLMHSAGEVAGMMAAVFVLRVPCPPCCSGCEGT